MYRWLDRYEAEGLAALTDPAGSGSQADPFPPSGVASGRSSLSGLLEVLASDPREHGQAQTRWTLAALRAAVPSFAGASLSGIWRVLPTASCAGGGGATISTARTRAYQEKLAHLATIRAHVDAAPLGAALLYLDEVTYYRQPSLATATPRPAARTPAPSAPPGATPRPG